MSTADLKSRLADLKARTVTLSAEDTEDLTIYKMIDVEESRLSNEREAKRTLDNKRKLDAARRKVGANGLVEMVDLESDTPGAGTWFVTNPPTLAADTFKDAIKENGRASDNDVRNLVMDSLIDPDPLASEDAGNTIRDAWDKYPFAVQSLSSVVMRLGGLKIEEKRRKSA